MIFWNMISIKTIFKTILVDVAFYYFCCNICILFKNISRKPLYDNTVIIRYEKGATDLFYFSHSNTHVRSFICISYNIWMSYLSSEKYPFDFQLNLESLLIHSIYYSASVNEHAYVLNFKEIFRVTFNWYIFQEEYSWNVQNLWCLMWYNITIIWTNIESFIVLNGRLTIISMSFELNWYLYHYWNK